MLVYFFYEDTLNKVNLLCDSDIHKSYIHASTHNKALEKIFH